MPAPRLDVIIAGGGVAGLEALLALHELAGPRVKVELLAPEREFAYRPLAVGEPFGLAHPARIDLAELAAEHGAPATGGTRWPASRETSEDPHEGLRCETNP